MGKYSYEMQAAREMEGYRADAHLLEDKKTSVKREKTWCVVCGENWTYNTNGICNECDL
jgi:hypothetical protein